MPTVKDVQENDLNLLLMARVWVLSRRLWKLMDRHWNEQDNQWNVVSSFKCSSFEAQRCSLKVLQAKNWKRVAARCWTSRVSSANWHLLDGLTHVQAHLHTVLGMVGQWLRQTRHAVVTVAEDFDAHALVFLRERKTQTTPAWTTTSCERERAHWLIWEAMKIWSEDVFIVLMLAGCTCQCVIRCCRESLLPWRFDQICQTARSACAPTLQANSRWPAVWIPQCQRTKC